MALVTVDIEGAIPHSLLALLSPEFLDRVLTDIADIARQRWVNAAATQLTSSRRDYIDSIQPTVVEPGRRIIALVGWLANAVEAGLNPFRLHDTLLNDNARVSKAGYKYRAIPFRHATPGAKTHQAGAPMGSRLGPTSPQSLGTPGVMSHGEAAQFGRQLHKIAKRLSRRKGRRRGVGQDRLVRERITAAEGGPKLAPWHTTGLYTGMQKGGAPGHSGYQTFRTISDNPEAKGLWLHPGISARNLAEDARQGIQQVATGILRNAVREAVRGGFR
jgi:hypothetical protein